MTAAFKGITVGLHVKTDTGSTDAFGAKIYAETVVDVQNVLVTPTADASVTNETSLDGTRTAYELSIPKGDTHDWTDTKVDFFGQTWRTYGDTRQWIDHLVPLDWNKKVLVERYD